MNNIVLFLERLIFVILSIYAFNAHAKNENTHLNKKVISTYVISESYSNILPIKQLIKDDWYQAPADKSSKGFTHNEIGVTAYWNKVSFNVAQRLDYLVDTNADTANAFYLERQDLALTSQESYHLALKLNHLLSNGFRVGYKWPLKNFTTELKLGYWRVNAIRDSILTGEIYVNEQNNITGNAHLNEFYSSKNFLKRENFNTWDTNGYGLSLDLAVNWQLTNKLDLDLTVTDLFTRFKMKNLGYSQGNVNTEGTFINGLGGNSYLPLYRGIETAEDHHFKRAVNVNFLARYRGNSYSQNTVAINYLTHYKRQGDLNFFSAGIELAYKNSVYKLLVDFEHLTPELHYQTKWVSIIFAVDDININTAKRFTLGIAANYYF